MWPPETVLLGRDGPTWRWHRAGIVVGHPDRVMKGDLTGSDLKLVWWWVSNRYGARMTLATAIKLYDPFQ